MIEKFACDNAAMRKQLVEGSLQVLLGREERDAKRSADVMKNQTLTRRSLRARSGRPEERGREYRSCARI